MTRLRLASRKGALSVAGDKLMDPLGGTPLGTGPGVYKRATKLSKVIFICVFNFPSSKSCKNGPKPVLIGALTEALKIGLVVK